MLKILSCVSRLNVPRKNLNKALEATLALENFKKECEVSLLFVNNLFMKKINKFYRKKDLPTDVLAFPMQEGKKLKSPGKIIVLGDIVISADKAKEQSKKIGQTLSKEITLLFIHGLLHLLNYKDKSKKQRDLMDKKQSGILDKLF